MALDRSSMIRSPFLARALRGAAIALALQSGATAQAQQALLGVYYGNQGWAMDQLKAMEAWQGKRHAVVNLFTDWCNRTKTMDNLFKQQLPAIWANGNVPMITWEPFLCTASATPADLLARIGRGEYDTYLKAWAERLRLYVAGPDGLPLSGDDRRVYLRFAHEMNGNWYPWSIGLNGNTGAHYQEAWRRTRAIFVAKGLDQRSVQWVWAVNNVDSPNARAEEAYPGDAQVDWVAIDGYNWGASQSWSSWQSPQQVFDPMAQRLRAMTTRPLALTETAATTVTTGGVNVGLKSQWITDLMNYTTATKVRMLVWFNEDKETDWAIFGGSNGTETYRAGRTSYKAYGSYRQGVQSGAFVPGNPAPNARVLTDTQFGGAW
ncbi:MAG: glycosyl hydrolase [Pseudomonadota bacterium]